MMGIFSRLVTMSASVRSSTPSAGKSIVTRASLAGWVAGAWALAASKEQKKLSSRTGNAALQFINDSLDAGERVSQYQGRPYRAIRAPGRQHHARRQTGRA